MTRFIIVLLAALLWGQGKNAFAEPPFRVSGIFGLQGGAHTALIVGPESGTKRYRKGDSLEEGKVVEIDNKGVTIEWNGKRWLLPLEGDPVDMGNAPPAAQPDKPKAANHTNKGEPSAAGANASKQQFRPIEPSRNTTLEVYPGAVVRKLTELLSGQRAIDVAKLNQAIGLPANVSITAVNGVAVQSPQQAATLIRDKLDAGGIPRLNVSGYKAGNELYLTPHPPLPE